MPVSCRLNLLSKFKTINLDFVENINYVAFRKMKLCREARTVGHQKHFQTSYIEFIQRRVQSEVPGM